MGADPGGPARDVPGARQDGRVGAVRHWTNSNLHAYVEPAGDGYRLRMGTKKGDAAPLTIAGGILLAGGM